MNRGFVTCVTQSSIERREEDDKAKLEKSKLYPPINILYDGWGHTEYQRV